ncbi:hypothetical protein FA95DRAFT_1575675 [Auriscalpium vulgare]|uniref:Uncharacterized protein n=1 Tax=Auriscalpium vulgare TaxID=40419 RepID=A0ACB8REB4_9AGAM|nr:hypothetical protein FA95DRAFT_1575675 [Auriscalpium vulgare]
MSTRASTNQHAYRTLKCATHIDFQLLSCKLWGDDWCRTLVTEPVVHALHRDTASKLQALEELRVNTWNPDFRTIFDKGAPPRLRALILPPKALLPLHNLTSLRHLELDGCKMWCGHRDMLADLSRLQSLEGLSLRHMSFLHNDDLLSNYTECGKVTLPNLRKFKLADNWPTIKWLLHYLSMPELTRRSITIQMQTPYLTYPSYQRLLIDMHRRQDPVTCVYVYPMKDEDGCIKPNGCTLLPKGGPGIALETKIYWTPEGNASRQINLEYALAVALPTFNFGVTVCDISVIVDASLGFRQELFNVLIKCMKAPQRRYPVYFVRSGSSEVWAE